MGIGEPITSSSLGGCVLWSGSCLEHEIDGVKMVPEIMKDVNLVVPGLWMRPHPSQQMQRTKLYFLPLFVEFPDCAEFARPRIVTSKLRIENVVEITIHARQPSRMG
jgi:hypothetical protein